ncbi:MAG: methyltransferase domain-containing protein [Ferruginibacter sp.]
MDKKNLLADAHEKSISITHRHILSIINTMLANEPVLIEKNTIRILDAGCGDGKLLYFLHLYLPLFNEGKTFLIYGYDVIDHGVQQSGYIQKVFAFMAEMAPGIDWSDRIKMINSDENWPFENNKFDFVVSNQVLEHVWDHDQFFRENNRVLADKGFSIHLFPVKEVIWDGHVGLLRIHQLKSWDAMYRMVKFYSRLNLGIWRKTKKEYNNDLDHFSRVWADKIYHYCNYQSYAELTKAARKNHLCLTPRFTLNFYTRKLKEITGNKSDMYYPNRPSSKVLFFFLKYLSSVTLVLYKGEYAQYGKKA